MKIIFTSILILISIHKGGTDSRGGHNDNINGGYHYHHGCAAHSHSGGCIYNYEDCEREYSYSNRTYSDEDDNTWTFIIISWIVIIVGGLIKHWWETYESKEQKAKREKQEEEEILELDKEYAKRQEDNRKKKGEK